MKCQFCNGTGEEIDHKQLGSRLRAERERQGMSQGVMAGKLGMTQGFLSDLERGRRNWLGRHIKAYQMALAPGAPAASHDAGHTNFERQEPQ